jgi:Cu-Zn family superoxide dismutase
VTRHLLKEPIVAGTRRRTLVAAASAAVVLAAVPAAAAVRSATPDVAVNRAFQPVGSASTAFTYDEQGVARGATATVEAFYPGDGTVAVTLELRGLQPFRTYGAHAHVGACTEAPAGAGGHWHFSDAGADPLEEREIWLDVTTDEQGFAKSVALRSHEIPAGDRPMSVVVHALPTDHVTGAAGARLACVTVPF